MRYRVLFVLCILFLASPALVNAVTLEGKKDICLSESIIVERGKPPVIRPGSKTSDQYKSCKLGIGGIENCGKVSFTGPATRDNPTGRPCAAVPKCSRDYNKRISQCVLPLGLEAVDNEIDVTPEDRRPGIEVPLLPSMQSAIDGAFDLQTDEGRNNAIEALRSDGISRESAERIIDRLVDGDEIGASTAYRRELALNPDLLDKIRLGPGAPGDEEEEGDEADAAAAYARDTTFGSRSGTSDEEEARWKVYSYGIAKLESGGNYRAETCTYKGCALGKYQVMDFNLANWTRQALGQTLTREQFLNCAECQEKVFRTVFGQYLQRTGGDDVKAAMMWFGGPGALSKLNATDPLGTSVWRYGQKYASITGGTIPDSYGYMGRAGSLTGGPPSSPFGNVNPFTATSPSGYAQSAPAAYPQQQPIQQQYPPQQPPRPPVQPVSSQILAPTGQTGSGSLPPAPVQPVASLIVQPKDVTRGNFITVSWSTVGMSTATPCAVSLEKGGATTLVAQGNEGTKRVPTDDATANTTWNFRLKCTSGMNGSLIQQSASVLIK